MRDAIRWIDAEELRRRVPLAAAVEALESALSGPAEFHAPVRSSLPVGRGELLSMPASGAGGAGVKLVTVRPEAGRPGVPRIQGLYVLFAADSLSPLALIDAAELTAIRTPAVTALATRYLAREDAATLVVFGAGIQAAQHVKAMAMVRPITRVRIVSPVPGEAEALARRIRETGLEAREGAPTDVSAADIVCTCTSSSSPLFDGSLLRPGTHVNAMGAHRPDARELDDVTVQRARIVVEERSAALAEAGDLLLPLAAGVITEAAIAADLRELVNGVAVRESADDITVFKSVGTAWEDLVVAQEAYRCAS